jgi:hypothetical protein
MLTKRLPTIDRRIRDTSRQISFEFLFIKTLPPDKLHIGFGFVIQFRVRIRYVICQGGNCFRKRNSKEIWREVSLFPRPTTSPKHRASQKWGSYMLPFWNHILGFIYVDIAKIAVTWKLAKKIVSGWGFEPGTKIVLAIGAAPHPPPHLLCQSPFFLYTIGYIWIHMHENLGHRGIWIHMFHWSPWIWIYSF